MNNYKSTCVMEIAMAIAMGAILCIIIAYCIAVYSIHRIDEEVKNIGTLYAMGYLRKEMVRHYLIIPMLIAVIGSVAGTIIGVALSPAFATINTAYFSMPVPSVHISPLMVAYGILVPVIPSFFINYIVLNKKLKEKPVNMLRQTASGGKKKQKKIESDSFVRIFRKRQLASEMGGNIVLFFGIFFSVMMLVLDYSMKGNINNLINYAKNETRYEYMYILKHPTDEEYDNTEKGCLRSLKVHFAFTDTYMPVTMVGFDGSSDYFKVNTEGYSSNDVLLSRSAANKFMVDIGDTLKFFDSSDDSEYVLNIKGISEENHNGMYVFMALDSMNELFENEEGYYNTVFSDKKLDIASNQIVSVTTKDDIVAGVEVFENLMKYIILSILGTGIVMFVLIMYLLVKMMIDHSRTNIAYLRVLGYLNKDLSKLYIGSTFFVVLISAAISIPVNIWLIKVTFPLMTSNMNMDMEAYIQPESYIFIILLILISYLTVNAMLKAKLKKMSYAEVLKNRE